MLFGQIKKIQIRNKIIIISFAKINMQHPILCKKQNYLFKFSTSVLFTEGGDLPVYATTDSHPLPRVVRMR